MPGICFGVTSGSTGVPLAPALIEVVPLTVVGTWVLFLALAEVVGLIFVDAMLLTLVDLILRLVVGVIRGNLFRAVESWISAVAALVPLCCLFVRFVMVDKL